MIAIDKTSANKSFKARTASFLFDGFTVKDNWNVTIKRMPRKKKKMLKKILSGTTGIKSNKIYIHYADKERR